MDCNSLIRSYEAGSITALEFAYSFIKMLGESSDPATDIQTTMKHEFLWHKVEKRISRIRGLFSFAAVSIPIFGEGFTNEGKNAFMHGVEILQNYLGTMTDEQCEQYVLNHYYICDVCGSLTGSDKDMSGLICKENLARLRDKTGIVSDNNCEGLIRRVRSEDL